MKKKFSKAKYKRYEKLCLEVITENNVLFFDEITIYSDIKLSELSDMKLHSSVILNDAIDMNRAKFKHDLRLKWFDSTNATLNVALYKLICSEDEKRSFSSASTLKTSSLNDACTQEDYLKSLRDMGGEEQEEGI